MQLSFFSIVICPVLVILLERTRFREVYGLFFRRFGAVPPPAAVPE